MESDESLAAQQEAQQQENVEQVGAQMSDDEAIQKLAMAMQGNAPTAEEKQNVYTFLHNVATENDTTKVGFLRDDEEINELGLPQIPVRAFKSMALISEEIMGNDYFKRYFEKEAEIITSTSLSRQAMLLNLAVIQRREIADVTRRAHMKSNKGWFKKKQSPMQMAPQQPQQMGEPVY